MVTPVSIVETPAKSSGAETEGTVIPSATPPVDNPYALPANLFPLPDNVTGTATAGNFSSLALASGVLGGMPSLFLLYSQKSGPSTYSVVLRAGSYNVTTAWLLLSTGTCSPGSSCHQPIRWGYAVYLANSSTPIQGVALVSFSGALVAAYATGGSTYFAEATDGGVKWIPINHVNGTNPAGSVADGDVVFTVRQGNASSIQRFGVNCGTPAGPGSVTSTLNGTPVVAPSGAEGELVSSATNHSVLFYPILGGSSLGSGVTIGTISPNSTSPIFDAIGSTQLATSPGYPGQLAATAVNNTLFGLYATSVNGRTAAATVVSGDGGTHWSAPDFGASQLGTIESPEAVAAPSGLIYVSWMSNANGSWQIEQSVYTADGRLRVGPNPIPGSGGTPATSVIAFSATVTPNGQPFYAWIANVSGLRELKFSGADISAFSAAVLLNREAGALAPLDFVSGSSSYKSTLSSNTGLLVGDIANGHYSTAANLLEGAIYQELTSSRLALLCAPATDPQPACTVLQYSSGQLLVQTAGPLSAASYLSWYVNLTLAALGVGVTYPDLTPHELLAGAGSACGSQQFAQVSFSNTPPPLIPVIPGWLLTWAQNSTNGSSASGFSHVVNPKAANLSITYDFATTAVPTTRYFHTANLWITWCNVTSAISYRVTVKVGTAYNTGPTATFSGGGKGTTVYLVNLTANGLVYWGVTVKATVQKTQYTAPGSEGSCPAGSPSKVLSTSDVTLPGLAGYLNTSMGIVGAHVNASATGANRILVSWNNSMPAQSWLNITPPSLTNYYNPAYVDPETFVETNLSSGTYSFSGTSLSQPGGIPPNSKPNVSENIGPPTSTAEKGTWTEGVCGFVPGLLQLSNVALTNITITNASLSWQTNFRSNGTVSLYTFGDNTTTTTSWVTSETGGGSTWTTKFELHGLREFTSYSFRILVNMTYCGITYNALSASTSFQTPDDFYVWAYDEPYDSITQEGGGTQIAWVLPQFFVKATTFSDGTIVYYPTGNNSATAIVPLLQVSPLWPSGLSDSVSFVANLSLPLPNTNYTIAVLLNYTYVGTNQSVNATSFAYTFTHLKDTSGDGLTDSEKIYGWSVTTQTTTGSWNPAHDVTADPTLWATNGLTNDFVEKEFGLDPGTVDSAGSHVLDTWNLTFDLGRSNQNPLPPAGADLHYWYANSSLHPFSSCQYPGQPGTPSCSSFIQGANLTNLTQAGDSSPWSSEVLWDRSQLSVFYNLTGVKAASWLRAEFGSYGSLRTLTIWGKLSWGANPLATSTPQDGLADGQRINPLYDEDLQMDFLNYGVDVCGNIPSMAGAALQLHVTGAVGGYAGNNYTAPINLSACPGGNGGTSYELTLPVDNTVEAETVEVTFIANISTNASPAPQLLPVNACNWRYNLTVAMLNATPETNGRGGGAVIVYGNPSGSCGAPAHGVRTHVSFGVSEVPAGLKVPTYLWIPNDNSTLSSLPWGLKRYTGEQSFDLVTITDTDGGSHVRSDLIPTPWGGPGYYVSATTGMIQFLVPRGQFLNSTFGESILLNSTLPNAKVPGNGPLLASNQSGAIANNSNPATLADLSCYWQNRAVWNQPWLCSGGETGTPSNHTATLTVVDASSCGGSNCGGVPFNPSLETTAYAGPALQFVASFNLSSTLGSTSGELDAIVAALVDNSSGGLNGTFVNITTEIPTLALSSALVTSMANAVLPSGGNYGVPVSHAVAPPKPSGNPFVAFLVNSASGILYDIQTGNWLGVIWDVITAPLAFQVFLAVEMAKVYLAVANRTASALAGVGAALKAELASFLDWIITQAKATLATGTSPVTSVTSAYSLDVNSSISVAGSTIGPSGNISQGGAQSMWAAQSGTLFQDSVTLSYIVAVVFGIVVALTAALASMLVSALLGLLLAFAVSAVIQLTAQSIAIPLIYGVEDWANGTCGSQAPNQVTWRTLADSIGWYDAGMTSSLAGRQLWIASHSSGGASLKSVALFVFSLIAAVVGFYSYFNHSNQLAVWSLGMGAIGLFFDLIAGGVATSPVDKQIVDASFALDIAAFGISALELHN